MITKTDYERVDFQHHLLGAKAPPMRSINRKKKRFKLSYSNSRRVIKKIDLGDTFYFFLKTLS
jgi:hypothetical protein